MARFAVHAEPNADGYLLDVQADAMEHLNTRMVVPLLPAKRAPLPATTLNPVFRIGTVDYVMATQYMAAVPRRILKQSPFSLAHRREEILAAIDLLLQGF
jgi:toxin CcdB